MIDNSYFIEGILHSDERVIREIYSRFFSHVLSFVMKNNGSREDAEDVFQAALLQISARIKVRELKTINSPFGGYLFGACKNLWRREIKKKIKRVTTHEKAELGSEVSEMVDAVLEQEKWDLFEEKLTLLSETCKELMKLFFQKMPYRQIQSMFSYSSEEVARQRVFKCKKRLIELVRRDAKYNSLK